MSPFLMLFLGVVLVIYLIYGCILFDFNAFKYIRYQFQKVKLWIRRKQLYHQGFTEIVIKTHITQQVRNAGNKNLVVLYSWLNENNIKFYNTKIVQNKHFVNVLIMKPEDVMAIKLRWL